LTTLRLLLLILFIMKENDDSTAAITRRIIQVLGGLLIIGGLIYMIWRFSFLIVYILIAAAISFIGQPIVRFLDKLHIRKFHIPHGINTLIALLLLIAVFSSLFVVFVPLILQQAETISKININQLTNQLQGPLANLQAQLTTLGIIPKGETIATFLTEKAKSLVNLASLGNVVNGVLGVAGSLFVDIFSILFISFFFMKDDNMFGDIVLAIPPEKHLKATKKVLADSKMLLHRYFIGVTIEIFGGMALITLGLLILGVPNALLLGFFGGLMNIIPYVGPILGTAFGLTLGLTGALATGDFASLLPLLLKIAGVFIVVHELDTTLFQPWVYSSSVKAHPLEIFFAIIIGGTLGGIVGMLIAVPTYTVLRVIAREFFNKFRVVKKLTERMDVEEKEKG
jgi:predicted PurR-regulated permease PerM